MPKPLNFSGQSLNDDVRWQVAMSSIHYTHSFYNFREPCVIHIMVDSPPDNELDEQEIASPKCRQISWGGCTEGIDHYMLALLRLHLRTTDNAQNESDFFNRRVVLFGELHLPARHYSKVSAVWDDVIAQANTTFEPLYHLELQARLANNGTVSFTMSNGKAVTMYTESQYIGKVLGLDSSEIDLIFPIDEQEHLMKMYKLDVVGVRTPKLDNLQALYIYGCMVEHQRVGDTMAPLLAYVDVSMSPGERARHICNPLVYLSVNKSIIDTITIRICDEYGNEVKFPDDVANVVVRLCFRQTEHAL
jgi:hypothetical protein